MHAFTYYAPTRLCFGQGVCSSLGEEVRKYGNRVLLVYGGGSIKRTGIYQKVKEQLHGTTVWELSGVEPNPKIGTVRRGVEMCKKDHVEVVLAVGGGSAMDCAKAICAGALYDGDPWELVLNSSKVTGALPLITVVTMAATGSEFDAGGVISNPDTNEKMGLVSPELWPKASFIDPVFTYSVPRSQVVAGSCDILSHYMEQYFTTGVNLIGEGFLESEMKAVMHYTPVALKEPENFEARAHLSWAATLGCNRMASLGCDPSVFVCHAIEHELSAFYDITHGIGLAIITPRVMRYILNEKSVSRVAQFSRNVMGVKATGNAMEDARAGIAALRELFLSWGVPEGLSALNIGEEHFKDMAAHACAHNPLDRAFVPLTESDVIAILKDSL